MSFLFQSLSDEESFKKISSTKDVLEKIQELLSSLVERWVILSAHLNLSSKLLNLTLVVCLKTRMQKDGRQPQTFRLTIRRYSATNKWFSRESRQSPIPNHIGHKITSGELVDTNKSNTFPEENPEMNMWLYGINLKEKFTVTSSFDCFINKKSACNVSQDSQSSKSCCI